VVNGRVAGVHYAPTPVFSLKRRNCSFSSTLVFSLRRHIQYDEEFKKNAVKLTYGSSKGVPEIAEALVIGSNLLYRWRRDVPYILAPFFATADKSHANLKTTLTFKRHLQSFTQHSSQHY